MGTIIETSLEGIPIKGEALREGTYSIGSSSGPKGTISILLEGKDIEQEHAKLVCEPDRMILHRVGAKKPVWVNERKIGTVLLTLKDVIRIGDYSLTFVGEGKDKEVNTNVLRKFIHKELIDDLDLGTLKIEALSHVDLWKRCETVINDIIQRTYIPEGVDKGRLKIDILREALGLGALEELLDDDTITEIMVNDKDNLYVEREGKLEKREATFTTNEQILTIISRIVTPIGRRIDESQPMVDARLRDGSRVNAIIPPLAISGPSITIRKFAKAKLSDKDLIKFGSLSEDMARFIEFAVKWKRNIVISGGTGSGKTTLLNVLSNFIPENERVVTIEDSAELKIYLPNLVSLEARPPNIEGTGAVPIRDLVKNALRMRPDRIIIGECRGGESLDMLQAMNTGHDGSLTTLHANNSRDAVLRIETMVMMAGYDLPVVVIRKQIASAIHLFVQQNRFSDGSRRIISIAEVVGFEEGEIVLKDIFVFNQSGIGEDGKVLGYLTATGYIPKFVEDFERMGIPLSRKLFKVTKNPFEPKGRGKKGDSSG